MSKLRSFSSQKVAVITGATKGLGRALALTFSAGGYAVIGLYHSDDDAARAIELELHQQACECSIIRQDITVENGWFEFDEIIQANQEKPITLIANASASFTPKPFHLIDWTEVNGQMSVHVKGTWLTFKRLLPNLVKAGSGSLITVLTRALQPVPKGFAAYVTAKSSLAGLTKAIAAEYGSKGLRVFSVSPGFMETSLTSAWPERLKAAIEGGAGPQTPMTVAATTFKLAEDPGTPAEGEDYVI